MYFTYFVRWCICHINWTLYTEEKWATLAIILPLNFISFFLIEARPFQSFYWLNAYARRIFFDAFKHEAFFFAVSSTHIVQSGSFTSIHCTGFHTKFQFTWMDRLKETRGFKCISQAHPFLVRAIKARSTAGVVFAIIALNA